MASPPRISVVAATHNRARRLQALLDALRAQTVATNTFEVIVVDDGSEDDTPSVLARARADGDLRLRTVRRDTAAGPATARNAGWRAAQGPVIAFTDDDCVPMSTWLEELLRAGAEEPMRVVQGRTAPDPAEAEQMSPFARTMEVAALSPYFETCNITYPRSLLDALQGFDEGFPAPAGEDADLGYRALEAGATVHWAPDAVVHHTVDRVGARAILRLALRARDEVPAFARRAEMRRMLFAGVFYKRSHPQFLLAAVGLVRACKQPAALLLALPYAIHLRKRLPLVNGSAIHAPFLALCDAVEVVATVRGAVRHRYPVL